MCGSDNSRGRDKEKFKVSLETRNFEIELFWKRSLFFWGFIASAFLAFASLEKDNSNYAIVIANFGMVCSFAWTLANRGSKFWIDNWEDKLFYYENYFEKGLFAKPIGTEDKCFPYYKKRFSVSKLAIALSDFTFSIWLGIVIIKTLKSFSIIKILNILNSFSNIKIVNGLLLIFSTLSTNGLLLIFSILFIIYMLFFCKGKNKN